MRILKSAMIKILVAAVIAGVFMVLGSVGGFENGTMTIKEAVFYVICGFVMAGASFKAVMYLCD